MNVLARPRWWDCEVHPNIFRADRLPIADLDD
jgi:hypothetical protein